MEVRFDVRGSIRSYLEKNVNDKNIEDIFERIDDTVKYSLEFWHTFNGLEWS